MMTFYDEMTDLVDKETSMDIVYLDFSKAFDTVPHKILIKKLMKYGLDEQTENWLNGWAQRVMISDIKSSGSLFTAVSFPGEQKGSMEDLHYLYCWKSTGGLPTEQHCDVTQLKKSGVMNDEPLCKPPDSLAKQLCLPFPTSHSYQTHMSRYTMFPNFRSPVDQDTGIDASSHQPFHPNIPTKAFDVVVLRKIRGILLHWDFDSFLSLLKGQIHYPNPPKTVVPHSTFKELEHNLSPRTSNIRSPVNPLILVNYYMKAVGRLTGEPGEDMGLKKTFLPSLSQVRPLERCTACLLQGQRPHESILQEQYPSSVQMPPPFFRDPTVVASYSGTILSKIKTVASTRQQCKATECTDQKWDVSQEQATLSQTCYHKVHYLDTWPPINKLQKITDTLQTEALYRRQLSGRPELESLPKSACSLSYKDLRPRHLDLHTIWENPVSVSKSGLPLDVKSEESRILLQKLWHQEACQPAWRPEDGSQTALPAWISSCEVPRHQAALLELHSFSKTAAQKHFQDSVRETKEDIRDNITEGERHKFYGLNDFYFFNRHTPPSFKNRDPTTTCSPPAPHGSTPASTPGQPFASPAGFSLTSAACGASTSLFSGLPSETFHTSAGRGAALCPAAPLAGRLTAPFLVPGRCRKGPAATAATAPGKKRGLPARHARDVTERHRPRPPPAKVAALSGRCATLASPSAARMRPEPAPIPARPVVLYVPELRLTPFRREGEEARGLPVATYPTSRQRRDVPIDGQEP
ncbi:LOW QUALITY PROTEIN: sperm-associated microtubule inner protein 4 [Morus bassanus]